MPPLMVMAFMQKDPEQTEGMLFRLNWYWQKEHHNVPLRMEL